METLVVKVLQKYLTLFIKNFTKDNFSISFFKSQGNLSNLVLNEKVIQELLWIPPNLEVKTAACNDLLVKIPWTNLKHEPILIRLDKVELEFGEPAEVSPMPNLLQQFRRRTKRSMTQTEIAMDVTIEINEISVKVQTLPSFVRPTWTPILEVKIKNVSAQSTNSKWQVVDLAKAKEFDRQDNSIQHMHKAVNISSISVAIHTENGGRVVLLDAVPMQIHMISKWRLKEAEWLGGSVEVIEENFNFKTNLSDWSFIVDFVKCVRNCFQRPVPERSNAEADGKEVKIEKDEDEDKDDSPTPTEASNYDFGYIVSINKWALQISDDSQKSEEKVFHMEGSNLRYTYNTAKKLQGVNSPTSSPSQVNNKIFAHETFATLVIPNIKLSQTLPSKNSTTVLLEKAEKEEAPIGALPLDMLALKLYWFIQDTNSDEEATLHQKLTKLQWNLRLDSLQVLFDRKVWNELREVFLHGKAMVQSINPEKIEEEIEKEIEQAVNENNKSKIKEKVANALRKRMGLITDWNDISIVLEAINLSLSIPAHSLDIAKNNNQLGAIQMSMDKLTFMNQPKWDIIPLLDNKGKSRFTRSMPEPLQKTQSKKALPPPPTKKLPAPPLPPKPSQQQGTPQSEPAAATEASTQETASTSSPPPLPPKQNSVPSLPLKSEVIKQAVTSRIKSNTSYKFQSDMMGVIIEILPSPLVREKVFQAASVRVYSRYSKVESEEESADSLSPRVSEIEVVIHSGDVNLNITDEQFSHAIILGKSYAEIIKSLVSRSERVKELRSQLKDRIKAKVKETGKKIVEDSTLVENIQSKVNEKLQQYKVAFYFKADKGDYHFPMQNIFADTESSAATKPTGLQISPSSSGSDKQHRKAHLKFEGFELGFENTTERQNAVFKLKSMQIPSLDVPGQVLTFEPLTQSAETSMIKIFSLNTEEDFNLQLYYSRLAQPDGHSLSEIWLRLQDLHMTFLKKPSESAPSLDSGGFNMPNVQNIIQKAVEIIDKRREQLFNQLESFKDKQDTIKQNLQKLKFDLRWELEMGDCELTYSDTPSGAVNYKPKGILKVANLGQSKQIANRFHELEHQIIQSKTDMVQSLSQAEIEKDEMIKKIRELQEKLEKVEKEKGVYEGKYVDAKMELSKVQMENADLERNLFAYQKNQKK